MDADRLRAAVERDAADRLDLLGSPDLLRALSGGDPRRRPLLEAAAASEAAARETFRLWLDDESDPAAREAFERVVEQETRHRDEVRAALDGGEADGGGEGGEFAAPSPSPGPGPMHAYLRGRPETVGRVAGGMVGRTLVSLRTHPRYVAYFEDAGDPETADLFRRLRADTEGTLADGLALLEARRECEEARERARAVAGYVIRLAAEDAADVLLSE